MINSAWNRRADLPPTLAEALAVPEVQALVEAARKAAHATKRAHDGDYYYTAEAIQLQAALARLRNGGAGSEGPET